jgi:hypothetical protein
MGTTAAARPTTTTSPVLDPLDAQHIAILDDLALGFLRDVLVPTGHFQRIVPGAYWSPIQLDRLERDRVKKDKGAFRERLASL